MRQPTPADGPVLVTTGSQSAAYQCIRSLGQRGIQTIGVSNKVSAPFVSKHCNEHIPVPSPYEDWHAYRDALFETVARRDISTVIPCREIDAYLLSKYRDEFEEHVSLTVPSFDSLKTVHDRMRLVAAAEKAGVPVPKTRLLKDVDDWSDKRIIKSRYNLHIDDYIDTYPSNATEMVGTVIHPTPGDRPSHEMIREEMKHEPIVQEFVEKCDEYLFGALYDHGEPLATFQHKQIRGNSYTGGGGVYRKSVYIEELEAVARRLLDRLDWHGLACIEYIKDANTGEFKFVEINPRMWQSLPAAACAGADFPHYYWLCATGQPERIEPSYETGVGCHRLNGELGYLLSVIQDDSPHIERPSLHATLWEILRSCVEDTHFDFFHRDDPVPFLRGVRWYLTHEL
jgi:predicted ATP-grasp superfamily ATP-dependent carboligase